MIKEMKGDLLTIKKGIIAHQVNCKGVMGAGVAKQIRNKLLTTEQYHTYRRRCAFYGDKLLGSCYIDQVSPEKYVAHLFGENIPTGKGLDTDYGALERSLTELGLVAIQHHLPIAIPGYLGCGLAGGDWEHVYRLIIKPHFASYPYGFTIVYNDRSIHNLWEDFGAVPMDPETERIESEWHVFNAGTHREEIWHWFEQTFDLSVAEDLMCLA